jgi:predicted ATPase with chaperone activity
MCRYYDIVIEALPYNLQSNISVRATDWQEYRRITEHCASYSTILIDPAAIEGQCLETLLNTAKEKLELEGDYELAGQSLVTASDEILTVLLLARTIANLDTCLHIKLEHLTEAIQYKSIRKGAFTL